MIFHEYSQSGNCYKIRLTAALLGIPVERREYDIQKGETRTPEFLANVNPNGRIPVLQIGERSSPKATRLASIWLAFVGEERLNDLQRTLLPGKRESGEAALKLMDEHLAGRSFLVGDRLSLADIALYAYTHVAEEGGFELARYPAVTAWIARIASAPGYLSMDA